MKDDNWFTHEENYPLKGKKRKSENILINKRRKYNFYDNLGKNDLEISNVLNNEKNNNTNIFGLDIDMNSFVNIFNHIKLGLCIVKKGNPKDEKGNFIKKTLDVSYFNHTFSDLLQIKEKNKLKSKDVLKIFKEFIYFNEYDNSSPFFYKNPNIDDSRISQQTNKSKNKEMKDNFNNFENLKSTPNHTTNKLISPGLILNRPNSSSSLKFISRKSKLLKALDLYDILANYLSKNKNEDSFFKYDQEDDYKINENQEKNEDDLKNIKKHNKNLFSSNVIDKGETIYNRSFFKEVKEFRFMRQNLFFSVRIQEIDNFLVLIFENLDEEKKQIQNNLIKSIKSQYIITISHELNNPLNGLIHCIEELDYEDHEKKGKIVKKIKRFKFMIKFFLKNIITNFKFFLNEPINKKSSNISFGFILQSIKRSLFEFYEYKNICIIHDFSNLDQIVLQYDYFYFRYLLKNIFMYFYYKVARNGKLLIEIEKEGQINDFCSKKLRKKFNEEMISDANSESDDTSEVDNIVDLNLGKLKTKSPNAISVKRKITMIFKTENKSVTTRKSSRNVFDKSYFDRFDIENSIQTLEMLIESINKISKLLGIKIDFSNFNKRNSSMIMNLFYYIDEDIEEDYNDISEYIEEYDKYKANCVFSIQRTIINEEKKVFLNPSLNWQFLNSKRKNNINIENYDSSNLDSITNNSLTRKNYIPTIPDTSEDVNKNQKNSNTLLNISMIKNREIQNLNNVSSQIENFENIKNFSINDSINNFNQESKPKSGYFLLKDTLDKRKSFTFNRKNESSLFSKNKPALKSEEYEKNIDCLENNDLLQLNSNNSAEKIGNQGSSPKQKQKLSLFETNTHTEQQNVNNRSNDEINQSDSNNIHKIVIHEQHEQEAEINCPMKSTTEILSLDKNSIFYEELTKNNPIDENNFENMPEIEQNIIKSVKNSNYGSPATSDSNSNYMNRSVNSFAYFSGPEFIPQNTIAKNNVSNFGNFGKKFSDIPDDDSKGYNPNVIRETYLNKNKQIFFNTYNTYLNIDNVAKLEIRGNSSRKDDFLNKYCYNSKNGVFSNKSIFENKSNIIGKDNLINIKNPKKTNLKDFIEIDNQIIEMKANDKVSLKFFTKKDDDGDDSENENKNPSNKNSNGELNQNILLKKKIENGKFGIVINEKIENNYNNDNNEPIDPTEYYDNYDSNLQSDTKKIYPTITKNQLIDDKGQLNINYIRSPRLFFHYRKPVLKIKRPDSKLSNKSIKNTNCDCQDILLVDDETFNLGSMKFMLKKKKLSADSAINGRESIDKIKQKLNKNCQECKKKEYKIIFMDIMMPELDGIEASNIIQKMVDKNELSNDIKIIICTAHDSEIIRQRTSEIKIINEFVSKPVKKSIVDDLLNKYYFNFQS